ncbi:uncharacterized protein LOC131674914 [Phymastichus coffea]|nr:uncharacterized protein LOC131674914 [Phymastichus coffea]
MFDELAKRPAASATATACSQQQPQQQQQQQQKHKHLSFAQRRESRAASVVLDMSPAPEDHRSTTTIDLDDKSSPRLSRGNCSRDGSPTQFRYGAQRRHQQQNGSRPVSGSSLGSSSSSSGCSLSNLHQHHHRHRHPSSHGSCPAACNPYLASVESLADTCASSQGSGDSGVVTISESSGNGVDTIGSKREKLKIRLSEVDRATAARPFDQRRPPYCDPQRTPVERVLLEILITEAEYVDNLRQVIQGYLIIWRNDPTSLIGEHELNGLFSNIEDIYEFNSNFLSALDASGLDPVAVANNFVEHNAGFKVYTEYCTNYPRTCSLLTELNNQEEIARAFSERQLALAHGLPLGSFLLKPVQRILKYHLLLERLSKQFEVGETREAIEEALKAMTGIAEHINAMKRKHEHAVRVQEIQSLLLGWPGPDLTTGGELVAEGSFRMRGAKAPRHAFLFDKMLLLTKKREDGLLVYKAHILCSNLTLMESIPGDPLSFHVIPFDNSQLQYKLQARNLEQKREWTLQIKRVILENYNAAIPAHARQLVLQIGQNKYEDDLTSERSSKKADRERRRSEISIRQKLKKGRKSDVSISTADNSPMCSRKNQSAESIRHYGSRNDNLNRSSEIRGSKIKNHFTSWRRKSEPGFQSYINLNPSDNEDETSETPTTLTQETVSSKDIDELDEQTKENSTEQVSTEQQSVKEIVGNILMQSEEFQRRIEKQQTYQKNVSSLHSNIAKHAYQRCNKSDTSEEEDTDNEDKPDNNRTRSRFSRRDQCFVRAVNAYNQRSFRSQYDSFRNVDAEEPLMIHRQNSAPTKTLTTKSPNHEKRSPPDTFKKPNFGAGSKIIRTALRIREDCDSASDQEEAIYEAPIINKKNEDPGGDKSSLCAYDNLQNSWHDCLEPDEHQDCPTKAAVWLTKLCEGLPNQPQKSGSLPRSFQMMNPADLSHVSKSRFLQRDGKSMSERPFTIASDKPAEINLEDMERYASTCQGSARIAKFPTTGSSSTFFCSLDDASFTDADSVSSRTATLSTSTYVHPDHKIYRANGSVNKESNNDGTTTTMTITTGSSLRNVFSRASSRIQSLRSSQSTETLDCSEEFERSRYFRSFSKRNKHKNSIKSSSRDVSDAEDAVASIVATGNNGVRVHLEVPYHRQGSPSLGARIAQSDYADPSVLFSENRKTLLKAESSCPMYSQHEREKVVENELDSFYEKSFETIENYAETEEAFRDSAIFSDGDSAAEAAPTKKVPPPIPMKKKIRKPVVTQKPAHLKLRARIARVSPTKEKPTEDDVSAGQSQIGWVKKMVGQLQAQVDV